MKIKPHRFSLICSYKPGVFGMKTGKSPYYSFSNRTIASGTLISNRAPFPYSPVSEIEIPVIDYRING